MSTCSWLCRLHPFCTFSCAASLTPNAGRRMQKALFRPVHHVCQSYLRSSQRRSLVLASELKFGQPLHESHPHLLEAGDLTPGISALEYHHRRAALARKLPRNSIAVLAANELKYRTAAVFYEYHQDPNFRYLTGFEEPESFAIIGKFHYRARCIAVSEIHTRGRQYIY